VPFGNGFALRIGFVPHVYHAGAAPLVYMAQFHFLHLWARL
jgi:hypothetical protein